MNNKPNVRELARPLYSEGKLSFKINTCQLLSVYI